MGRSIYQVLFAAPEINPVNRKAKSVPLFNPFDPYGRVFLFSWLGFLVAFMSWYAFPPLLTISIKADLGMTQNQVANSNIFALLSTFLVRFVAGPLCDKFGPRWVFIGILLAGAVPTAMAGLVTTPNGLIALRFFVGILGASFVPCQVWCTAFFDKSVVGTANALAGGWGNAGGGITYFIMPALFDSLVHVQGLEPHKAWRVAYIVPFIIITSVALCILFFCPDTPTGKWSERHLHTGERSPDNTSIIDGVIVTMAPSITDKQSSTSEKTGSEIKAPNDEIVDCEAQLSRDHVWIHHKHEIVVAPTFKKALGVFCSKHSLALALPYACSFGGELAINSILGAYYLKNFPTLGQTKSGQWAAMFGLLNVIFRPLGGFIADLIFRRTNSVWAKKHWITFLGVAMGIFEIAIGMSDPKTEAAMFGLVAGLAFFMDASNGANFAVVPHVHPHSNGILSGMVGALGNLGGVIFSIVFRYNGKNYGRSIWIVGVISTAVNLAVSWIAPVPKEDREKI